MSVFNEVILGRTTPKPEGPEGEARRWPLWLGSLAAKGDEYALQSNGQNPLIDCQEY